MYFSGQGRSEVGGSDSDYPAFSTDIHKSRKENTKQGKH